MGLNQNLINYLREAQNAHKKAASAYAETAAKYRLTEEGHAEQRAKMTAGIAGTIQDATAKGLSAIEAKIEELNAAEASHAAARAADTDYQQRLSVKLGIIKNIDLSSAPADALKQYLAEYENDTLALNALTTAISKPMSASAVLPPDNNGSRQARLRKVAQNFTSVMESCAALEDETNRESATAAISSNAILENLVQYLIVQDDNFSLSESDAWERMHQTGGNEPQKTAEGAFNFNFKGVR